MLYLIYMYPLNMKIKALVLVLLVTQTLCFDQQFQQRHIPIIQQKSEIPNIQNYAITKSEIIKNPQEAKANQKSDQANQGKKQIAKTLQSDKSAMAQKGETQHADIIKDKNAQKINLKQGIDNYRQKQGQEAKKAQNKQSEKQSTKRKEVKSQTNPLIEQKNEKHTQLSQKPLVLPQNTIQKTNSKPLEPLEEVGIKKQEIKQIMGKDNEQTIVKTNKQESKSDKQQVISKEQQLPNAEDQNQKLKDGLVLQNNLDDFNQISDKYIFLPQITSYSVVNSELLYPQQRFKNKKESLTKQIEKIPEKAKQLLDKSVQIQPPSAIDKNKIDSSKNKKNEEKKPQQNKVKQQKKDKQGKQLPKSEQPKNDKKEQPKKDQKSKQKVKEKVLSKQQKQYLEKQKKMEQNLKRLKQEQQKLEKSIEELNQKKKTITEKQNKNKKVQPKVLLDELTRKKQQERLAALLKEEKQISLMQEQMKQKKKQQEKQNLLLLADQKINQEKRNNLIQEEKKKKDQQNIVLSDEKNNQLIPKSVMKDQTGVQNEKNKESLLNKENDAFIHSERKKKINYMADANADKTLLAKKQKLQVSKPLLENTQEVLSKAKPLIQIEDQMKMAASHLNKGLLDQKDNAKEKIISSSQTDKNDSIQFYQITFNKKKMYFILLTLFLGCCLIYMIKKPRSSIQVEKTSTFQGGMLIPSQEFD